MGKGSTRRLAEISKEEEDLRWKIAFSRTKEEKDEAKKALIKLLENHGVVVK